MSGANDPYDPKQVAALSPEALDDAVEAARKAFDAAADLAALAAAQDDVRDAGRITDLLTEEADQPSVTVDLTEA